VDKKGLHFRQNDESVEIHKKGLNYKIFIAIICDITDRKCFEKGVAGMYGSLAANLNPMIWGNAALGCLAAVSAATDLCCGKVYNIVTVPGICLGVFLAVQQYGAVGLLDILFAAGFTLMLLLPFYRAGGLGAGDIKLLTAVSAFMPGKAYLCCFAGAFFIGAAAGIIRLFMTRGSGHTVHFALPVALSVMLYLAGVY
jgi:prepilin peptidase CpaA